MCGSAPLLSGLVSASSGAVMLLVTHQEHLLLL